MRGIGQGKSAQKVVAQLYYMSINAYKQQKFTMMSLRPPLLAAVLAILGTRHAAPAGPQEGRAVAPVALSFEAALNGVMTENPDARIAEARIAGAQAMLLQAQAALRPQLAVQSSYARTSQPVSVFGTALNQRSFSPGLDFNNVPDADNWNTGLSVSLPLYTGGQATAGRAAAAAAMDASVFAAAAVRQALALETARAFIGIHRSRALIRAAEAGVAALESNLEVSRQRLAAGTALKTDTLDLEVGLAQAREELARSRNANALARQALASLLGLEDGGVDATDAIPGLQTPPAAQLPQRAEVRAAESLERAAAAKVTAAAGGLKPGVEAFGQVEHNRGTTFDNDGSNYTVGIRAQWNIWDGGRVRAQVKEAQASLTAARESVRRARLMVNTEVQQARLALSEAAERLKVSERSVELAAESVKIIRGRFAAGLALSTQLIDAETALTAARVRRAEAEADERLAIAALRRALGLPMIPTASK